MIKIDENILSWCPNLEAGALEQAINIAKHPKLIGNVCLMPDCHQGYGMPVGGVCALDGAVSPNMTGVDIGCGMLAVKTNLTDSNKIKLKKLAENIKMVIPTGMKHHEKAQDNDIFTSEVWNSVWNTTVICKQEKESARYQLGTLGGGNHFIEIQKGSDGHLWFMIHSGSRNLGFKVANHYNKVAENLCKTWGHDEVVKNELAFLPIGTIEYDNYIKEMDLCLEFAYQNRQHMSNLIKEEVKKIFNDVEFNRDINIHHNYATLERHYGKNVMVHRKGATLARESTIGIIPGSMGTKSYIVRGKGNEASLCSCSHGAGRILSRSKAVETLDFESEKKILDDKNIIHNLVDKRDLEEATSAYKDIDVVMENQKDLVDILVELKPLAVIKG